MSEPSAFGFGQFVQGFDFLQNLSKTASAAKPATAAGMPGMGSWVAPTLNIEDIDKRIQELKSVLFWLEQNTTALKAAIQAMEVQKMTLNTLQSMNVNMADLAKAFTAKPPSAEPVKTASDVNSTFGAASASSAGAAARPSLFAPKASLQAQPVATSETEIATPVDASEPAAALVAAVPTEAGKPAVDPMQWWGALTQQFQGIAAAALKDVAGDAMNASVGGKADTKPNTKTAAKVKVRTTRKASTSSKAQAPTAPSHGKAAKQAGPAKRPAVRAVPVKATRVAAKSTTQSPAASPRKDAKK